MSNRDPYSDFRFFERYCGRKKGANSPNSGLIANGRARRQGRRMDRLLERSGNP